MSEEACRSDPTLVLVRGWYLCPIWGKQAHWWCCAPDGTIMDPTVLQFPSGGTGEYIPFDGILTCEYCGKDVSEEAAYKDGHHVYCGYECYGKDVM